MKKICYKKCKDSGLKYTNGVSSKMIQSNIIQMVHIKFHIVPQKQIL